MLGEPRDEGRLSDVGGPRGRLALRTGTMKLPMLGPATEERVTKDAAPNGLDASPRDVATFPIRPADARASYPSRNVDGVRGALLPVRARRRKAAGPDSRPVAAALGARAAHCKHDHVHDRNVSEVGLRPEQHKVKYEEHQSDNSILQLAVLRGGGDDDDGS